MKIKSLDTMPDIDIIIPCYGESKIINQGLASIAGQWKGESIHVTLVNDCSPNTDCNYQDLVERYKDDIDIRCITTPENYGQGLTRQYGIDHTEHEWFMFMDEDDRLGTPLMVSQLMGHVEGYYLDVQPDGTIPLTKSGKLKHKRGLKQDVAFVSAPLFEFDNQHTHVIPSSNQIWLNAKLYNRKFIEKHDIRFNKRQSRHAEDYYWMSCFFFCADNDPDYMGIITGDEGIYYLWYPNEKSQSRKDPHYGFMLSGYTMDGSVNILKFMKDKDIHGIEWSDSIQQQYDRKLLNMTVYSFFTFLSFLRHVSETDYVPELELDWTMLRDACKSLRDMTRENFDKYPYMQKVEELFGIKNHSDVQYSEPWVSFDDYICKDLVYFDWSYDEMLENCKEKMKFENGKLVEEKIERWT